MEYVKHDTWFEYEYEGKRYRGKYTDRGWSFRSFAFQIETIDMQSSIFQWTPTPYYSWKTEIPCIDYDYRTKHLSNTEEKLKLYPANLAKRDLIAVIKAYLNNEPEGITYVTKLK